MKHEKVLLVRFVLKVPPQILLFRSHGIANMTLFEVSFCLDSSAEAITRGFPALKAKQTVQCDSKRGMHWTGLDLFLREVTVPTLPHSGFISFAYSMLCFSSLSRKAGLKTLTFSTQQ